MNNNHFLVRMRNMRNELLKQTDYYMLLDVYENLTPEQKKEMIEYRQKLRNFVNDNYDEIFNKGNPYVEFPQQPSFTNLYIPKY